MIDGKMIVTMPYGDSEVEVSLPKKNIAWIKSPNDVAGVEDEIKAITDAIKNPIGVPTISELVKKKGKKVVLLVDDMTRSTPQDKIIPIVLDELNHAGVEDDSITAIIALGTHRPMTEKEMFEKYGENAMKRIRFINHDCKNNHNLIRVNDPDVKFPVYINKLYYESDISIAIGNIIPHMYAGWSGGSKMIQPGVCGAETTGETHLMASEEVHHILGVVDNPVRAKIEKIAEITGLTMIINTVLNKRHQIVKIVAGDPIKAHRAALPVGEKVYSLELDDDMDIIIASANPAYLDFWQSIKAFNNCAMGVREGGVLILLCHDSEGIAPDHPDLVKLGTCSRNQAKEAFSKGEVTDKVALATYLAMSVNRERVDTYIVSEGISKEEAAKIGLKTAVNVEAALQEALKKMGNDARIGVVTHGADIYFRNT